MDAIRDVQRQIEAASVLKAHLAELAADDDEFIRDTLEGEVDFERIVAELVASLAEDEAIGAGIKQLRADLKTREERYRNRAELKRTLLASALEIAGRKKIECPGGTVSLAPVQPKAIVVEEAEIPARFWKPQPPTLDKAELAKALRARATAVAEATTLEPGPARDEAVALAARLHPEIPGATLSNGGVTVRINVR